MSTNIEINAIIWSSQITKAIELAQVLTGTNMNNNGYFTLKNDEYTLNTYIRSPNEAVKACPSSITDIVFVHIENPSEETEQARSYLDSRRGIPFKVCLTSFFGEMDELECKYINPGELSNEKTNVLKEALAFEKTLINVFNKFDLNGNGLISTDELIKVSLELGHEISHDDAKMITDTLDKEKKGNIDFNGFKKWWVMGKTDFTGFRRIVKAEMAVHRLVKLTSTKFNEYLSNLNEESQEISEKELEQSIDINLHSSESFENGIGMFINICRGEEAKEIFESLPENLRNTPAVLTLSLTAESNEIAQQVVDLLKEMVIPLLEQIPNVALVLQMGCSLNFRANGNKIVAEISFKDMLAEIAIQNYNALNLGKNMSGEGTFHLFTAVNVDDIFAQDFKPFKFIDKFLHSKLHFSTKAYNLKKTLVGIGHKINELIAQSMLPSKFRFISTMISLASGLKNFNLDFNFDTKNLMEILLVNHVSYLTPEVKENIANGDFNSFFEKACELDYETIKNNFNYNWIQDNKILFAMKEQASEMKEMVPPEILDILKGVSLEEIELQVGFNAELKFFGKYLLKLPGLNNLKNEILG